MTAQIREHTKAFRSPLRVARVTFFARPKKVTQEKAPRRPLVPCATRLSRGSAYSASCAGCRRAASLRRPYGPYLRQAALLGAANGDPGNQIHRPTTNTDKKRETALPLASRRGGRGSGGIHPPFVAPSTAGLLGPGPSGAPQGRGASASSAGSAVCRPPRRSRNAGDPRSGCDIGVPFSLVTFSWASKRKSLGRRYSGERNAFVLGGRSKPSSPSPRNPIRHPQ